MEVVAKDPQTLVGELCRSNGYLCVSLSFSKVTRQEEAEGAFVNFLTDFQQTINRCYGSQLIIGFAISFVSLFSGIKQFAEGIFEVS